MFRKTTILAAPFWLMAAMSPALAQAIDLSKPLGNPAGCTARETKADDPEAENFYLTQAKLVTANSICTFVQTLTSPDGTLVITALCELDGEEGRSINPITVTQSKSKPGVLAVYDEYGEMLSEVSPCP